MISKSFACVWSCLGGNSTPFPLADRCREHHEYVAANRLVLMFSQSTDTWRRNTLHSNSDRHNPLHNAGRNPLSGDEASGRHFLNQQGPLTRKSLEQVDLKMENKLQRERVEFNGHTSHYSKKLADTILEKRLQARLTDVLSEIDRPTSAQDLDEARSASAVHGCKME